MVQLLVFAKCLVDFFSVIFFFKSPHIYWNKHSWLMDSINLMTSKPRRENMFMSSIISIDRRCKTATLLEDERTALFIWGDLLFLFIYLFFLSSQRTAQGYPHKMLMMCCLLRGSVINLCASRRFPSLFLEGGSDEQKEGRGRLGLSTFTPHVLSSRVNITALFWRWGCLSITLQRET